MLSVSAMPTDAQPLRVLSVCVGNICRSPVSALLLQRELGGLVDSTSAGTHALVGEPVYPPMARRLADVGVPAAGAARQVTPQLLRDADLVLTMTRDLRARVVELAPAIVRRTFTLAELAAIVEATGPLPAPAAGRDGLVNVIADAAARRSLAAGRGADPDIADPFGRGEAAYEQAFKSIRSCVAIVSAAWR